MSAEVSRDSIWSWCFPGLLSETKGFNFGQRRQITQWQMKLLKTFLLFLGIALYAVSNVLDRAACSSCFKLLKVLEEFCIYVSRNVRCLGSVLGEHGTKSLPDTLQALNTISLSSFVSKPLIKVSIFLSNCILNSCRGFLELRHHKCNCMILKFDPSRKCVD